MQWSAIASLVVERMAEYQNGSAETPWSGGSTMAEATIYSRMSRVYRDLIGTAQQRSTDKFEVEATMTYTAGAKRVALPVAVARRPVLSVYWEMTSVDTFPLEQVTRKTFENYLKRNQSGVPAKLSQYMDIGYLLDGQSSISIVPVPSEAMTLTIRYIAGLASDLVAPTRDANGTITVAGDSAGSPDLFAEEHHATIALGVALSFLREVGRASLPLLEAEYARAKDMLVVWAERTPRHGPRYVHEED